MKAVGRIARTSVESDAAQALHRMKHAMNPLSAFAGEVTLIIGGGEGLGKAAALKIAAVPSAIVMVAGLPEGNGLQRVAERCGTPPLFCDVTKPDQVDWMMAQALEYVKERTGEEKVHRLLYVSGVASKNSVFFDPDIRGTEMMNDVNVLGYYRVLNAAKEALVSAKGHVTIFSSMAAKVPLPGMGCYAGTKGDVFNLTESMEQEMYRDGVRFTTLIMSFIESGMTDTAIKEASGSPLAKVLHFLLMPQDKAMDIIVPGIARKQRYVYVPRYMRLLCDYLPPVVFRRYKLVTRIFGKAIVKANSH